MLCVLSVESVSKGEGDFSLISTVKPFIFVFQMQILWTVEGIKPKFSN